MSKVVSIYALLEPDMVTVRYVGQTIDMYKRYRSHLNPKASDHTHRANWIRALARIGAKPIMVELEQVPPDGDWAEAEKRWIAYFKELGFDLVNLTDGGEGAPGFTPGEETRRKLSASHSWKGRKHSDTSKKKIGLASSQRRHAPETKERISESLRGRPCSDETRAKMAESRRLYWERRRAASVESPSESA